MIKCRPNSIICFEGIMVRFVLLCVFNLAYCAAQNVFRISNFYNYTYLGLSASSYWEAKQACERYDSELLIIHNQWQRNTLNELLRTYTSKLAAVDSCAETPLLRPL